MKNGINKKLDHDLINRVAKSVFVPIFEEFGLSLYRYLIKNNFKEVNFVARDGWFLKKCYDECVKNLPDAPVSNYLRISRSSVRAAACSNEASVQVQRLKMNEIKAGSIGHKEECAYFGLGEEFVVENSSNFENAVLRHGLEQREFIGAYVSKFKGPWVDIGWRGSIASMLSQSDPSWRRHWIYMGWLGRGPGVGLLSDSFIARKSMGAMSLLLESVCREPVGTCLAYQRGSDGAVEARLIEMNPGEVENWKVAAPLQDAILIGLKAADGKGLGFLKGWKLVRCAYFPSNDACRLAMEFTVSEGHNKAWAEPVCPRVRVSPVKSLGAWAAGFACPWKSAWAKTTSGNVGCVAYLAAQWLLDMSPKKFVDFVSRALREKGNGLK